MLTLTTDKQVYQVGEAPAFSVTGGIPGVGILWSAYKNDALVELQRAEGVFNGFGNYVSVGPTLTANDAGHWVRQIFVNNGQGSSLVAQVVFDVEPVAATPAPSPAPIPEPEAPAFFNQTTELFGQQVPTWALFAGVVLALLVFAHKR
jgi:hypothetical protein